MFTGIVQSVGVVREAQHLDGDLRIRVEAGGLSFSNCSVGDSVAVSGVCLTMIEHDAISFVADVSNETLALTTLARLAVGTEVNLETAMTLQDALGGHLVAGHVDGMARVVSRNHDGRAERFHFSCRGAAAGGLARFVAAKGSVTLDGVSLTVNEVNGEAFCVCLIPHTLQVTTLGRLQAGDLVNLEVDLIARYVERLISWNDDLS